MNRNKPIIYILLAFLMLAAFGCREVTITPDPTDEIVSIDDPSPTFVTAGPTAVPTDTPEPTEEPTPTPAVDPDPEHPYYLYVEKGSYTITIYGKDEDFNYSVVVASYRIAHGGNKTPTGLFSLSGDRQRWHTFPLGGCAQYATPYWGNLYIHSPLYGAEDPSRLWKSYYNGDKGIGTDRTGGCLRMVTEAAKFIYENCPEGTKLEIVNGNPKGTTSPDVPPIEKKGYDPTDVDALGGDD